MSASSEPAASAAPINRDELFAAEASTARSSIVMSSAQLVGVALGAVFALLVALIVGEGPSTDGFLAAYSAYSVFILFGSSIRTALIPLLGPAVETSRFRENAYDRIGRILLIAGLVSLALIAAAPLLGPVLMNGAGSVAKKTASNSIAILGAAAFLQVWVALLGAVLVGARRFVSTSIFFVTAAAVTLAASAGLMAWIGAEGAAFGVLAGACTLAVLHAGYLARFHFSAFARFKTIREKSSWRYSGQVAAGSILPMALQLNVTIALAGVAQVTGAVTAYLYAYMAAVVLTSMTAATIGVATMPNLVAALHRNPREDGRAYLKETAAFATYLYVPFALGYVLFGHAAIDTILGHSLTPSTLEFFWDVSRLFLLMGLGWSLFTPLITLALSQRKYGTLAAVAGILVTVQIALVVPLSSIGIRAVALGHATSGTLLMAIVAIALFRGRFLPVMGSMVWKALPAAAFAVVFPVGLAIAGTPGTIAGSLALGTVCGIVYLIAGIKMWPSVAGEMIRLLLARSPREAS